jgi:hypothetical protein
MRPPIASRVPRARAGDLAGLGRRRTGGRRIARRLPDGRGLVLPSGVSFHLISIQLGDETEMLDRAVEALAEVDPGETAFLPESLAWTAHGSGRAFARLIALAQDNNINIITSLNLSGDLTEDLPGRDPDLRYNALSIFTRHGAAHVPQAKCSPQAFEMDRALDGPGIQVSPYHRLNRVRLDVDDELVDARFLLCSDLLVLNKLKPSELACDLLVVLGNFAHGAEKQATRLIGRALEAGVAETALHVNAFQLPKGRRQPLAVQVEEVLDATPVRPPRKKWPSPRAIRSGFFVYDDVKAGDFVGMCKLRGRKGRIPVARSVWDTEIVPGEYPVTVVL